MTSGTHQFGLRAGIDNPRAHLVVVRLGGVFVTVQTDLHEVRSAKQILVLAGMRIMTGSAIVKSGLMLHRTGELSGIVATQALADALFLLQSRTESNMGRVTVSAGTLAFQRRMHHWLIHQRHSLGMALGAEINSCGHQILRCRALMTTRALSLRERLVILRKQKPLGALLAHVRGMAALTVRVGNVESPVSGRDGRAR